jgi:hypothetical protein
LKVALVWLFARMRPLVCHQNSRRCKSRLATLKVALVWLFARVRSFVYHEISRSGKGCLTTLKVALVRLDSCVLRLCVTRCPEWAKAVSHP